MHKNTDSIWTQEAQLLRLLTPSQVTSSLMIRHLVVCSVLGNASPQRQVMLLAMCSYLGTHPILLMKLCQTGFSLSIQFWQMLANTVISGLIRRQNRSNLKSYFPPQKNTPRQNLSYGDCMLLESLPVWNGSFTCAWKEWICQLY